jgi:hypothetical protein
MAYETSEGLRRASGFALEALNAQDRISEINASARKKQIAGDRIAPCSDAIRETLAILSQVSEALGAERNEDNESVVKPQGSRITEAEAMALTGYIRAIEGDARAVMEGAGAIDAQIGAIRAVIEASRDRLRGEAREACIPVKERRDHAIQALASLFKACKTQINPLARDGMLLDASGFEKRPVPGTPDGKTRTPIRR